jgi:hypothetical protein
MSEETPQMIFQWARSPSRLGVLLCWLFAASSSVLLIFSVIRVRSITLGARGVEVQQLVFLDPVNSESVRLLNRAEDESVNALPSPTASFPGEPAFPLNGVFRPSFESHALRLAEPPDSAQSRRAYPQIVPTRTYLPPLSEAEDTPARPATPPLKVAWQVSGDLPAPVAADEADLPQALVTSAQDAEFESAIDRSGRVVFALPRTELLSGPQDPLYQVRDRILALKFPPSAAPDLRWGTLRLRTIAPPTP